MTPDQLTDKVIEIQTDISAIKEKLKSADKQIAKNEEVIKGVYRLASSVESLTLQVKQLAEKMDASLEKIESRQRIQGERIGTLEQFDASIKNLKDTVLIHTEKIDHLEKEPGRKWQKISSQIVAIIIAAVTGIVLGKAGLM